MYPHDSITVTRIRPSGGTFSGELQTSQIAFFEADSGNVAAANCVIHYYESLASIGPPTAIEVTETPAAVLALCTGNEMITLTRTAATGGGAIYVNAAWIRQLYDATAHREFQVEPTPDLYQFRVTETLSAIKLAMAATTPGGDAWTKTGNQTGLDGTKSLTATTGIISPGDAGNQIYGSAANMTMTATGIMNVIAGTGNLALDSAGGIIQMGAYNKFSGATSVAGGAANTQASATQLTERTNKVTTLTVNYEGVALPTTTGPGAECTVINDTALTLAVWPAVSGGEMNGVLVPLYMRPGEVRHFTSTDTGDWYSDNYLAGKYSVLYDFDIHTGATGTYVLGKIPLQATVTRSWYSVVTTATSATDAGTMALGTNGDPNAFVTATAISGASNIWDAGLHEGIQDGAVANMTTPFGAVLDIQAAIAVEAWTAGKIWLHLEWTHAY